MSLPVALVVDTGVDDALALIVAARHPALDLRGVIATAGNVRVETALGNTRYVLDTAARPDVPVAVGADCRLDGTPFRTRAGHGRDGLGGLAGDPAGNRHIAASPQAVLAEVPVVVSLGPLTCLAEIRGRRIVASYARPGEANYEQDPVAGRAMAGVVEHVSVMAAPVPAPDLTGLDGTRGPLAALVAGLLRHQAQRGAGLGDAAVVLALAEPQLEPTQYPQRLVDLVGPSTPSR